MQIRKLLAGGLAAAMAGATLAFGAVATSSNLGGYVDGSTVPSIVIGSSASDATEYPKDVAAAGDIAAGMAGYATETVSISGSSTTSVSGGTDIATTNKKLYFKSLLNRARSTLTSTQLPTLLASGTADTSLSGTYSFDQYIEISAIQTEFDSNSGALSDPTLYVDMGTSALTTPAYNLTIVFSKALDLESSSVRGGTLKITGVEYTIGSESNSSDTASENQLVLLGGANTATLNVGDTVTVGSGDATYDVEFVSVTDANTVNIKVDGDLDSIDDEQTKTFSSYSGDVLVFCKYMGVNANLGTGTIELVIGADKITLANHQSAQTGTEGDTIQGTQVFITGDDSGISKLVLSVSRQSGENALEAGDSFTDPVLGTFKMAFHGLTPTLDSDDRDSITIDNSGTTGALVTMTDYRGNELSSFQFAYNGTTQPQLNSSATRAIHVLEGETVSLNDYVLLAPEQESDFGHLMQLTAMTSISGSNPRFTIKDTFSDTSMEYYFDSEDAFKTFYMDGQTYYAYNASGSNKMNFTWGDTTASNGDTGAKTTVFPLIRLAGGEYITFVQNQTLGRATETKAVGSNLIIEVPTGDMNITAHNISTAAGTGPMRFIINGTEIATNITNTQQIYDYQVGQVAYKIGISNQTACTFTVDWVAPSTTYISTGNNDNQVGTLVLQEEDNTTTKDAIITGLDYVSNSIAVEQLAAGITGPKDGETRTSDPYVTDYVNAYGTKVSYWATSSSGGYGKVEIKYPDDQAVATVAFGTDPSFSTAATGGSYEQAIKITDPVTKLDNEITATSALSKDLILIGGPCANTVVAALLTDSGETCDTWAYTTGLIKEVEDAFGSGQKALIIAGTTADDTRSLAEQVLGGTMSYAV